MTTSPKHSPPFRLESRAPPPSPVARAHHDEPEGDDDLAKFLCRSSRVPKLILPDRISYSREIASALDPPEISLASLISPEYDGSTVEILRSAARSIGCFQLVDHEIPRDLFSKVGVAASGVFRLSPGEKKGVLRSPERRWGFELEEDEDGGNELFWWCGRREEEMATNWRQEFHQLSDTVEHLQEELEKIGSKIAAFLKPIDHRWDDRSEERIGGGSALRIQKHKKDTWVQMHHDPQVDSMKQDVLLRMLMRSWGCSHALGLHICPGVSRFCIYVKKRWVRFRPRNDAAVIVTIGDQIQQEWGSGLLYKHVIGKAVFALPTGDHDEEEEEGPISISFFYSNNPTTDQTMPSHNISTVTAEVKTISLAEQVLVAACLALFYCILLHIYGSS